MVAAPEGAAVRVACALRESESDADPLLDGRPVALPAGDALSENDALADAEAAAEADSERERPGEALRAGVRVGGCVPVAAGVTE
jgi:hypothetical protein